MGRNLSQATPRIRKVIDAAIPRVKDELGETIRPTFVDRSIGEQAALYAQGRDTLENVNLLRKRAGMDPISGKQNLRKVTWTMASRHITDLHDDDPVNDLSRAVDIGLFEDNGSYVDGDTKVETDRYLAVMDVIEEVASEMLDSGEIDGELVFGRTFKNADIPHIEESKPYSTER